MPDRLPAKQEERDVVLLIDGHAFAYRAFFAIRSLTSPAGRPTNAIYGFVQMLRRLQERLQPGRVFVVWDGGLARERLELLPDYKANRPEMPADLAGQFDEINQYLDAAGIPWLCADGVEADDLVATLARRFEAEGRPVVIASSDKDFMQLVNANVSLANPGDKTGQLWGAAQVRAKTGVDPHQVVDWLSLIGDAVDNIPGVPQVGPKTATRLLNDFGSVVDLYQRLDEVASERLRQTLAESREVVLRNQSMVRLRTDLSGDHLPRGCEAAQPDPARLGELYRRWGFRTLLAEVSGAVPEQSALFAET